jgi:hypothetical protein
VKVRYGDFSTLTRQLTVPEPVAQPGEIYRLGCYLLGKERLVSRPLRLIGLGVSGLVTPAFSQLLLPLDSVNRLRAEPCSDGSTGDPASTPADQVNQEYDGQRHPEQPQE